MADQHSLFSISYAANLLGIHPQTLRLYEREGFVQPLRTKGNTRRYCRQDIEQIRVILHLTRKLGVNLAGVEVILKMQSKLAELENELNNLQHDLAKRAQVEEKRPTKQRALIKAPSRMLIKVS
ncbi:MAG: helix-turn-helix transcriptional regulator [bacterium]|nr:helix-turn-helix transcriptional regulator [bacterium]